MSSKYEAAEQENPSVKHTWQVFVVRGWCDIVNIGRDL